MRIEPRSDQINKIMIFTIPYLNKIFAQVLKTNTKYMLYQINKYML
jgi:hypothetical protein